MTVERLYQCMLRHISKPRLVAVVATATNTPIDVLYRYSDNQRQAWRCSGDSRYGVAAATN